MERWRWAVMVIACLTVLFWLVGITGTKKNWHGDLLFNYGTIGACSGGTCRSYRELINSASPSYSYSSSSSSTSVDSQDNARNVFSQIAVGGGMSLGCLVMGFVLAIAFAGLVAAHYNHRTRSIRCTAIVLSVLICICAVFAPFSLWTALEMNKKKDLGSITLETSRYDWFYASILTIIGSIGAFAASILWCVYGR